MPVLWLKVTLGEAFPSLEERGVLLLLKSPGMTEKVGSRQKVRAMEEAVSQEILTTLLPEQRGLRGWQSAKQMHTPTWGLARGLTWPNAQQLRDTQSSVGIW